MSDLEIVIHLQDSKETNDVNTTGEETKENREKKMENGKAESNAEYLEHKRDNIEAERNFFTPAVTHPHLNYSNPGLNSNLKLNNEKANSMYLISPVLTMRSDFKNNPLHLNLEVTNRDDYDDVQDGEVSPDTEEKFSPTVAFKKLSKKLHKEAKKAMDSKSYKDLLNAYCFFSKDGDENEDMTQYQDNQLNPVSSALAFQE